MQGATTAHPHVIAVTQDHRGQARRTSLFCCYQSATDQMQKEFCGPRASHFDDLFFGNLHHSLLYLDETVYVSMCEQVHVDWALAMGRRHPVAECRHRMGSSGLIVSAGHVLPACNEQLTGTRWQHDVETRYR